MPIVDVRIGDVLDKLRELPDESVHCVVTSPPYWGLRDYSRCSCAQASAGDVYESPDNVSGPTTPRYARQPRKDCSICHGTGIIEGVKDHQLGLEKTPEEYVQKLAEIFREVRRVLRDDGTLWLNMGDSYAGSGRGLNGDGSTGVINSKKQQSNRGSILDLRDKRVEAGAIGRFWVSPPDGLKQKDLVGIPWRVAFALQADGWYLRSDIIWSKPNPMPESVRDRPTKSHEYIFLLTKSERYFFDQEAVREHMIKGAAGSTFTEGKTSINGLGRVGRGERIDNPVGRNIRSVWEITTQPYPEAHFATFPEELPRRCIKAGTSEKGCCPKCGAPWERMVDAEYIQHRKRGDWEENIQDKRGLARSPSFSKYGTASRVNHTKGWQPTCSCEESETIPCTVLDPFAGSGTTGWVARSLGRKSILIELNPIYGKLIAERTKAETPDILGFRDVIGTLEAK